MKIPMSLRIKYLAEALAEINYPIERVKKDDEDLELNGELVKAYERARAYEN